MKHFLVLFITLGWLIPGVAQGVGEEVVVASDMGTWTKHADLPYAVQEIYPALHKERIYVAGGLSPDVSESQQRVSDRTIVYDLNKGSWVEGPALPAPRHHPYLVSTGDRLFSFGGFVAGKGGRWISSRDVLLLDESANRWNKVAEMPAALSETVAGLIGNKIYLVGGRSPLGKKNANWQDHRDVGQLQIFDVTTMRFSSGPDLPNPRNSGAGAVIDGKLHVVGGRVVRGQNRTEHEVFDPATNSWTTLPPLPNAQGGIAAANLGGNLYVFGGEYFDSSGGGVYAECWVFDSDQSNWVRLPDMPVPRHGLGAVAFQEMIFIVGGAAKAGGAATSNRLSSFRPHKTKP